MFKNKLFLVIATALFSIAIKAQTITIDDANFDLPAGFSYSAGGSVAIPFKTSGCFTYTPIPATTNKFNVQLCNAAGVAITGVNAYSQSLQVFYTTFINAQLPAALPAGTYTFKVTATTTGAIGDLTNPFSVVSGPVVNAMAVPVNRNRILLDQFYYGRCDGAYVTNMQLTDSSIVGAIDTFTLIDNYRSNTPIQKIVPNASKIFNLTFTPTEIGSTSYFRDAYYTGIVKSINGTTVSTKAYHIVNNSWNILIRNTKIGTISPSSCKGDTVSVRVIIDTTQITHLQQNFPGALVNVNWGDNSNNDYTICEILASNGIVKHYFSQSSCERNNSPSFQIQAIVKNPFNIINGPGITGTCAAGASSNTSANLFTPPKAIVAIDSVVCGNGLDSLIFKNLSDPGQAYANTNVNGQTISCAKLGNFSWYIDSSIANPNPYYQTPIGKVEPNKDTSRKFTPAEFGKHSIKLVVSNKYLDDNPCPTSDTTVIICVDTASIVPRFTMLTTSAGTITPDSIISCSPEVKFTNKTRSTFCLDSTQFNYIWRVHNAANPFNPNDTLPLDLVNGSYRFTGSPLSNSRSINPSIRFIKTGKYWVSLRVKGKCDTSIAVIKFIEANGEVNLTFQTGLDTVFYCDANPVVKVSYDSTISNIGAGFGVKTRTSSTINKNHPIYSFQASLGGSKTYLWSVKERKRSLTLGVDYQFTNSTTATSQYPVIQFLKKGIYRITDTFYNACDTINATQIVNIDEPPAISTNAAGVDTICRNSPTPYKIKVSDAFAVDLTKNDSVRINWTVTGGNGGTFVPATGIVTNNVGTTTPDILTPSFTPAPFPSGANLTLIMEASSATNNSCNKTSVSRNAYVTPPINSNDQTKDICSCSPVNYSHPGAGGILFSWKVLSAPNVTVPNIISSGYVSSIPDTLCLINNSNSGTVVYEIKPKFGNCEGDAYTLTVTVQSIPNAPTAGIVYPTASPYSLCSGESVKINLTSPEPTDLFSWTVTSSQGCTTGQTPGTSQTLFNPQALTNNCTPLRNDTICYSFKTISAAQCVGASTPVCVIVTPGPPVAKIFNGLGFNNRKVFCDSGCLVFNGVAPTALGKASWEAYSPPHPTTFAFPTADSSVLQVCGLSNNKNFSFVYKIEPKLPGCRSSYDTVTIYSVDTVSSVSGLRDSVICNIGNLGGSYPMTGVLTPSNPVGQVQTWIVKPTTSLNPSTTTSGNTTLQYAFNRPGIDTVILLNQNFYCPDKADTAIIRLYKPPTGNNALTLLPAQKDDRYCQGSDVDVKAILNPTGEDMQSWYYEDYPSLTNRVNIPSNANPLRISNLQKNIIVTGIVQTKGWAYGCTEIANTISRIIYVDSPSFKGNLVSADTIVCNPGNKALIKLENFRGDSITWESSVTGPTSGFGPLPGIPFGSSTITPSIPSTIWYRAVVKNGNCPADTSVAIRIFIPTASGNAVILNQDTAICGGTTITLTGNTPLAGVGYWNALTGYNNSTCVGGVNFYPGSFETTTNPVVACINTPGVYKFVWTIKNFSCPGTKDTITILNTDPIANNSISLAVANTDTVCKGSFVTLNGSVATGGGYLPNTTTSNMVYTWEKSINAGASWSSVSPLPTTYVFQADVTTWFRRYLTSDSCKSYSNTIQIVVDQPITSNTITAPSPVCTGTLSSLVTGNTPTGGRGPGSYTYAWDTASVFNAQALNWTRVVSNTIDYNPNTVLFDSLVVRRIVYSGKCSSISDSVIYAILPDAKANFSATKYTDCPPFTISNFVTNVSKPNTSYDWYTVTNAGVRNYIGTTTSGSLMPTYTMPTGPDTITIRVVANSTTNPICKSDSMSRTFYTSAKPIANFIINQDTGCASTTVNKTNFVFTNTTSNKGLFTYQWNLDPKGTSSLVDLPIGGFDFPGSATGNDTTYYITLQAYSPVGCASSSKTIPIKVRTKPVVKFNAVPSYQCSGGIVKFIDKSTAINATTGWNFGDNSTNTTPDSTTHIYNVNALTTFRACLTRQNECDVDSFCNVVTIAANTVTLNISVKPTDRYKCLPDTVTFYTNSTGGTSYFWDFGDSSQSIPSTKGVDSITHIYTKAGKYIVTLTGSTTCGTVVAQDSVFAFGTPKVNFSISPSNTICKGDTAFFTNLTDTFSGKNWNYGNGTGSLDFRTYQNSGSYNVKLTAWRNHTLQLGGTLTCIDSSAAQTIIVKDTMPGTFVRTTVGTACLPYVADFTNTTNIPTKPFTTNWNFGSGLPLPQSGNPVTNVTFPIKGQYVINMVSNNAGGCVYTATDSFIIAAPIGTWQHDTGYVCGSDSVKFTVYGNSQTDSLIIDYDGNGIFERRLYDPANLTFKHSYPQGGKYRPTVTLKSLSGCTFFINPFGDIKVDYVKAYLRIDTIQNCGNTVVKFVNLSTMDQTPASQQTQWTINGGIGRTRDTTITFTSTASGVIVKLLTTSISGCTSNFDTTYDVKVHNIPRILSDNRRDTACAGDTIKYTVLAAPSEDPIAAYTFNFPNGLSSIGPNPTAVMAYSATPPPPPTIDNVVVSTAFCSSTYTYPRRLIINPNPTVGISPNPVKSICVGVDTITLTANGNYNSVVWSPNFGIVGSTKTNSIKVSPTDTVNYTATVTNAFGCTAKDNVGVNVVPTYTIDITATPNDSICEGTIVELKAISSDGKLRAFKWSPDYKVLDTLLGPIIHVQPDVNTIYYVQDTTDKCPTPSGRANYDSLPIKVGNQFKVTFAFESITLQAGTKYTFNPSFGNQQMASYVWSPNKYFTLPGGNNQQNPEIKVLDSVCYSLEATSIFGCIDTGYVCVKSFCEASQVFIPNTFTPDGNGQNDYFYVTADGIDKVVSFRVFNRWGQVVFERAGFKPAAYKSNTFNPTVAWDGKFKGVIAPTDTYVYTCEVECGNGTRFTYTGSVTLIK